MQNSNKTLMKLINPMTKKLKPKKIENGNTEVQNTETLPSDNDKKIDEICLTDEQINTIKSLDSFKNIEPFWVESAKIRDIIIQNKFTIGDLVEEDIEDENLQEDQLTEEKLKEIEEKRKKLKTKKKEIEEKIKIEKEDFVKRIENLNEF